MIDTRKVMGTNVESGKQKSFNSVSDASNKTSIKRSRIVECLVGKRKMAGGYIWQYL